MDRSTSVESDEEEAVDGSATIAGRVEKYLPAFGIEGWVAGIDDDRPTRRIVELVAGGTAVASVAANQYRPDLGGSLPADVQDEPFVGFRFPPNAISLAAGLASEDQEQPLVLRDRATGRAIDGIVLPHASDAVAEAAPHLQPSDVSATFNPTSARELMSVINTVRFDAAELLTLPLAPRGAVFRGSVEVLGELQSGYYVIGGWAKGALPAVTPGVLLVDGRKLPMSMFLGTYPRSDLPPDALAFCGIMHSEVKLWRSDQSFMLALKGDERMLKSRDALSYLSPTSRNAWLNDAVKLPPEIKDLIKAAASGTTGATVSASAFGGQAAVDKVHVLPGFGALARGWVLAPVGQIERVTLRQGDALARSRPELTSIQPRPDLVSVNQALSDRTTRAGFAAICQGALSERDEAPTVQIGMSDGTEVDVALQPQRLRIGYSVAALEALRREFPTFVHEPAFRKFARGLLVSRRRTRARVSFVERVQAKRLLVFVMPLTPADARLAVNQVASGLGGSSDIAVSFLYGPDHDRSAVVRAVHDVSLTCPAGLGHFENGADFTRVLAKVLRESDCRRFTLVQQGCQLTPDGWDDARRFLVDDAGTTARVYRLRPTLADLGSAGPAVGGLSWTDAGLRTFIEGAQPSPYEGLLASTVLGIRGAAVVDGAAVRLHAPRMSRAVGEILAHVERCSAEQEVT